MMMKEGFQAAANKFNVKKEKKPRKKPEPQTESTELVAETEQGTPAD